MDPREVEKVIKHKSDFVFKTTKGKKFIDGDDWDWTRIDHVPAQILSHSEKLHFMLFKFCSYQIPRREEKEQEFSNVPALVARGVGVGPDSVNKGDFRKLSGLPRSTFGAKDRKVHGVCQLPEEYALCVVPSGAEVDEPPCGGKTPCTSELSSSYNLPKVLTADFQTAYASATLYQVRGDQIQRYGYAAFGLTVAPYLVMSLVNLASTMRVPDYSTMYLVSSEAVEEAQRREGSSFEGVVGTIGKNRTSNESFEKVKFDVKNDGRIFMLGSDLETSLKVSTEVVLANGEPPVNVRTGRFSDGPFARLAYQLDGRPNRPYLLIPGSSEHPVVDDRQTLLESVYLRLGSLAVGSIPVAIVGILSHFRSGQSTLAQCVETMMWLTFGISLGSFLGSELPTVLDYQTLFVYLAPSIGGFVVVGHMLMQYGTCIQL